LNLDKKRQNSSSKELDLKFK